MSSSSFAAPVAALDHPVMSKMMKELVAASDPLEGCALAPTTYTSVLSSDKYNDEHHRYWYVACQVAQAHFGVSLPDPLGSCDDASATPAQATAAKEIHECYLEGLEDVMMRFYNLGFSRVSTATHRYALDFSLWMRGYALYVGCGDYGPQFSYTKPLDFVAPFSQEYDDFHRHRRAQEAPPNPMAADFNELLREDRVQANAEISGPQAHSSTTAQPSRGLNSLGPDATIIGRPVREEAEPAPPGLSALPTHPTSQQPSRGANKRTLNEPDAMALAPPPKRPQPGLPQTAQRALTSMGLLDRNEVHQISQAKQQPQAPTVATQSKNQSQRPQSSAQAPRGHRNPKFTARVCGNRACGSHEHELADCLGPPSRQGDIEGCPLCNTQQHVFDCCTKLPHITKNGLFDTLVTRRANLPVIRTSISILSLASSLDKLAVLAETMPLTKGTAKGIYTERQPWKHPHPSKLFRDPAFPSDPVAFFEKLNQAWPTVVTSTHQDYGLPGDVPRHLTVFRREWICQLVPYRKVFVQAGVHESGRGYYPFVTAPEQRDYEKQHRQRVKQELSILRREQAPSQQRRN